MKNNSKKLQPKNLQKKFDKKLQPLKKAEWIID